MRRRSTSGRKRRVTEWVCLSLLIESRMCALNFLRTKRKKEFGAGRGAKNLPNREPMAPVNTRLDYTASDLHCMPQAVLL